MDAIDDCIWDVRNHLFTIVRIAGAEAVQHTIVCTNIDDISAIGVTCREIQIRAVSRQRLTSQCIGRW